MLIIEPDQYLPNIDPQSSNSWTPGHGCGKVKMSGLVVMNAVLAEINKIFYIATSY